MHPQYHRGLNAAAHATGLAQHFDHACLQKQNAQAGEALQPGGLMEVLRANLKSYAEEWMAVLDTMGRPYVDTQAHRCQDLHARCAEWAAIVSADQFPFCLQHNDAHGAFQGLFASILSTVGKCAAIAHA